MPMPLRECRQLSLTCAAVWRSFRTRRLCAGAQPQADSEQQQQQQQQHRLRCFEAEQRKQRERSERSIEKIEVLHYGPDGQPTSLYMNRHLSTPLDVAMHLSEELTRESVLASVNGSAWDMHRPLVGNCTLRFLHFRSPGSKEEALGLKTCNAALWRSGSMLLGSVVETAFKEAYRVKLISFPPPYLRSGSFVYDCQVTDAGGQPLAWSPSAAELRALSVAAEKLAAGGHAFEPLDVPAAVAREMFRHNDAKLAAVDKILEDKQEKTVTVYRVGDFVDISGGPMIASSALIGRFQFAAIHRIESKDFGQLLRVQGLAIPRAFLAHFSSVELLTKRAAQLNKSFIPTRPAKAKPADARP